MEGVCIACGEEAEGKPLYKKLGSNNLQVEVYDALIEMELLILPDGAKTNCYICWDCDETVAEEYTNFLDTERKRKCDEKKRKEQDIARNQKLNKKLTLAFKKARKDSSISKGDIPPVSKYKQREQKKVANRYYASNCYLCNNAFKNSKVGYLRFNMKKMVDDHLNVYEALRNLGQDITLDYNARMRRFICCQCYNKVRRRYKDIGKGAHSNSTLTHTNGGGQPPSEHHNKQVKRPTYDEHAAEIAKLIPPSLADMYKVITSDNASKNKTDVDVLDDLSYTESDSDSSDNSVGGPRIWNPKTVITPKNSSGRTFVTKGEAQSQSKMKQLAMKTDTCASCGVRYFSEKQFFWYSLLDMISAGVDRPTVSIKSALKVLDIQLLHSSKSNGGDEYICKNCFAQISTAYKNKIKSSAQDTTSFCRFNSSRSKNRTSSTPKHSNDIPRPLSVKQKLASQARNHQPDVSQPSLQRTGKDFQRSQHPIRFAASPRRYAVKSRRYTPPSTAVRNDYHLLTIINKSEHLRYKGKAVYLRSVDVNMVDVAKHLKRIYGPIIPTERLQNIHFCSNFMRSVRNRFNDKCILCLSNTQSNQIYRWLEDPVCPPHLMVPLRWARLSLGPSDEDTDLAVDDGKVCTNCYNYVKREFMIFVKNKIGLSLDDGKVSLKNYKVSFDSAAMSIVADPLIPLVENEIKSSNDKNYTGSYPKRKPDSEQNGTTINETHSVTKFRSKLPSICDQSVDNSEINRENMYAKLEHKNRLSSRKRYRPSKVNSNDVGQHSKESLDSSNESLSSSISNFSDEFAPANQLLADNAKSTGSINPSPKRSMTQFLQRSRSKRGRFLPSADSLGKKSSYKPGRPKRKRETSDDDCLKNKKPKLDKLQEPIDPSVKQGNKSLFADDHQSDEDYFQSSDNTAPFAQRKKIRTGVPTAPASQDVNLSNDTNNITKGYQNVWQILQGIRIDCLLSSNDLQPVKPESFTHGFLYALNFMKDEIGATDADVIEWLCKVFPVEFRNLGRKLCKEAVQSHLTNMYVTKGHDFKDRMDEALPLTFYTTPKTQTKPKCCLENVLDIDHRDKDMVQWQHYLHTVNLDNLMDGTGAKVANADFNSGLVYAMWRANQLFGAVQKNLIDWLQQTSPEFINYNCCLILAQNAQHSHSFIYENPSILVNLNVPIILSKEKLHQVVFIDRTSSLCFINRTQTSTATNYIEKDIIRKNELSDVSASNRNDTDSNIAMKIIKKSRKNVQICDKIPPQLHSSPALGNTNTQIDCNISPGICMKDLQANSTALVRVEPKDRAVTLASTSRGAPINVGGCIQLLPLIQPNGIVTLVPMQMHPNSQVLPSLLHDLENVVRMQSGLSHSTPSTLSFNLGANLTNLIASGARPFTANNNEHLNKLIEDLERKLKTKGKQKAIGLDESIHFSSKQKD